MSRKSSFVSFFRPLHPPFCWYLHARINLFMKWLVTSNQQSVAVSGKQVAEILKWLFNSAREWSESLSDCWDSKCFYLRYNERHCKRSLFALPLDNISPWLCHYLFHFSIFFPLLILKAWINHKGTDCLLMLVWVIPRKPRRMHGDNDKGGRFHETWNWSGKYSTCCYCSLYDFIVLMEIYLWEKQNFAKALRGRAEDFTAKFGFLNISIIMASQ